jgi:hypothetical protein
MFFVLFFAAAFTYWNNRNLSYLFWFLCALSFFLFIKTLLSRRKRILKFVKQYKHEFFNPTKKTEQALYNTYLGIDPMSGNILYVNFDKKQVVAIDSNCWRGYSFGGNLSIKLKNLKRYDAITEVNYIAQQGLEKILSLMVSTHYTKQRNGSLIKHCREKGLKYMDIFNV